MVSNSRWSSRREIVPRTKNGVEGYLASGLIKGIGPKTAADIVERFGVATLDILEHQPERLLEIRVLRKINWRTSEPLMQKTVCSKEL